MPKALGLLLGALACAAALGCAKKEAPPAPPAEAQAAPVGAGSAAAVGASPLSFVEDDLTAAAERARRGGKALFVDAWAPWCHTCLSMKNFVLSDPSLRPLAARAVFAAVDTDRPQNAAFLERHKLAAWPTFFVIDPSRDVVLGYWVGASSVREMREFIESSLDKGEQGKTPADRAFAVAQAAHAAGDLAKAASAYQRALEGAPEAWPRRSAALLGWMAALAGAKQPAACARLGRAHLAEVSGAAAPADFSSLLLRCARDLPDGSERTAARAAALARLREVTSRPPAEASVDDRSDALDILSEGLRELGDKAGAAAAQEARLALMERAAREARSPEEAQTFDYGRASAYLALGRVDEAIRMLQERERQMPGSYEPPARLASALFKAKRLGEALDAVDRALALSYGLRKVSYLKLRSAIQAAAGDRAGAIATLRREVEGYLELPPGQASPERLGDARRRLAEAEAGGGVP